LFAGASSCSPPSLLLLSSQTAQRISFVTEEIAKYTNDAIGGLLNASMGNVTELIVSIVALQKGALRLVQVADGRALPVRAHWIRPGLLLPELSSVLFRDCRLAALHHFTRDAKGCDLN
jgi:hypothetical protein